MACTYLGNTDPLIGGEVGSGKDVDLAHPLCSNIREFRYRNLRRNGVGVHGVDETKGVASRHSRVA